MPAKAEIHIAQKSESGQSQKISPAFNKALHSAGGLSLIEGTGFTHFKDNSLLVATSLDWEYLSGYPEPVRRAIVYDAGNKMMGIVFLTPSYLKQLPEHSTEPLEIHPPSAEDAFQFLKGISRWGTRHLFTELKRQTLALLDHAYVQNELNVTAALDARNKSYKLLQRTEEIIWNPQADQ